MKEVAVKASQDVAVADNFGDWGAPQPLGQDIIIPKILPMQPSSVMVTEGKAAFGEFRDSLSGVKLGSIVEHVEFIPFHVEKFWDIMVDTGNDQYKWMKSLPLIENPQDANYNDNLPWNGEEDGKKIRRVRRMNFYVILPDEVAKGSAVPYLLSFKSTSFREGRKIYSQMYMRNQRAKLPPPAYAFKLSGNKTKNDKGTFLIPTIEMGRASSKEEIAECLSWFNLIKKGGVKVDDSDLGDAVDASEVQGEDTGAGKF